MTEDGAPGAVERLAACRTPLLIGVRHHSPALAAVVGQLLDEFRPNRILIELPTELQEWLPWLAHPALETPVALGAARADGNGLAFYPFADFSPELAALRWAHEDGVEVEACDLPVGAKQWEEAPEGRTHLPERARREDGLLAAMLQDNDAEGVDDLWDRLVESHAPGSSPEALRRAALLMGWILRRDGEGVEGATRPADLRREAWMARRIARAIAAGHRTAAVVGAYHAPVLASPVLADAASAADEPFDEPTDDVVTSLVPYDFQLLDSRSGYPAGIRDPVWQQAVLVAAGDPDALGSATAEVVTRVTAELRRLGHAAGVPDAREAVRIGEDLARIRQLRAPGRRELVEALQTSLVQGELLGRGRVVAQAMDHVLVGRRRGRLATGTPRSGLAVHVEALLTELGLPGSDGALEEVDMRLDPLRSPLDQRRHLALRRLEACGVPYARVISGAGAAPEALTYRWSLRWQPATSALLELAGMHGVTLEQAASGTLLRNHREMADQQGAVAAALLLLEGAAECGLVAAASVATEALADHGPSEATLSQDLIATDLLERLASGLTPGLRPDPASAERSREVAESLVDAAVRAVDGLAGSDQVDDARAVASLVLRLAGGDRPDDRVRLGWSLEQFLTWGSPLMQGVAAIASVLLNRTDAQTCGATLSSWVDAASTREGQPQLAQRLRGVLATAAAVIESSPELLDALVERVGVIDDDEFLRRLPAFRDGFDVLSVAARGRFYESVCDRLGVDARGLDTLAHDPAALGRWATADLAGRHALEEFDPSVLSSPTQQPQSATISTSGPGRPLRPEALLSPVDRWRLILGHEKEQLTAPARRAAAALDELYGQGRGEGSRSNIGGGAGGGTEAPFPSVREWSAELEDIFGDRVRDEVLAVAAGRGRVDAALALEPEAVQPSVELLQQLLSLKGGLGEANLSRLRRLVRVIVDDLVRQLATRLRPALTGAVSNRRTRRPGGPLDLRLTVAANLHTARLEAGAKSYTLTPERLWFKTRTRRSLDWRVVLVVDVSGSMEASVIYAALMAAIISGLPSVTAHFVAFSTEVVDLSDRVEDPLALLLEISVGGGTNIAKGLRYARTLITVPARTIVVLITDFEEGGPLGDLLAEVRLLAEAGAHPLGLAALDDAGAPRYATAVAEHVVGAGMPVAALSPLELARWISERIR